jgi:hypothetical protein
MKKKNIIWFYDEIYRQEFLVIFTPTHRKFCELIKKETGICLEPEENEVTGCFHGMSNKKCGSLGLIWSSDKSLNLVHELMHACSWTLRNRDIYLTEESEESYAYYYTYLYRTIKERIRNGK